MSILVDVVALYVTSMMHYFNSIDGSSLKSVEGLDYLGVIWKDITVGMTNGSKLVYIANSNNENLMLNL